MHMYAVSMGVREGASPWREPPVMGAGNELTSSTRAVLSLHL